MPRVSECLAEKQEEALEDEYDDYYEDDDYDYNDEEYYDYSETDYNYEEEQASETNYIDEDGLDENESEEAPIVDIDEDTLTDRRGGTVNIPREKITAATNDIPTFIFIFCAIGGTNQHGLVSSVDVVSPGLGQSASSYSIPSLPSSFSQGGEVSAAYTGGTITACTTGVTLLSPYGFVFTPGFCFNYNLHSANWQSSGGKMSSYRRGSSLSRMGRYD